LVRLNTVLLAVAVPVIMSAQPRVGEIARLEDQRIDAVRAGQGVASFYDSAYRGITALGQYETIKQIRAIKANPAYARMNDIVVEVHGDTAVVTAIEGSGDDDLDLALRIWTRRNGMWTIVTAQTTWIGSRPNAPPPSGPLPNAKVEAFKPAAGQESIWRSQEALMRAFSDADPDSYKIFSTEKSLRMTTAGESITRDTWLNTIARRQKGPLAMVDEVKIAVYGGVAVVNLRGHEASPTRQSWIYLIQDRVWKLHLRYTTLIRQ
jgi:hypothetical protein